MSAEPGRPWFDLGGLSERLREVRAERDVTMAALARQVGVSASTIRRFETADDAEADGVLAVVAWLGEPPETFVVGSSVEGTLLPAMGSGHVRVDMRRIDPNGAATRTTIQRLTSAAEASGRTIASLTRVTDT